MWVFDCFWMIRVFERPWALQGSGANSILRCLNDLVLRMQFFLSFPSQAEHKRLQEPSFFRLLANEIYIYMSHIHTFDHTHTHL